MITREVVESVRVARPMEVVWAAATDWAAQGEWMIGTTVRVTGGDGRAPMEIVEWQPPSWCSIRHTGPLVRGTGGFRVEPVNDRASEFTWWERFELPTVLAACWPLGRLAVEAGLRRSLREFVGFCERFQETDHGRP